MSASPSSLSPRTCDVAVIGSGIVGLSTALSDATYQISDGGATTLSGVSLAEINAAFAKFKELADRYPDGDRTVQAATRQLDACQTPACLRGAYAQWQAYFDENYDLGDVVDYQ